MTHGSDVYPDTLGEDTNIVVLGGWQLQLSYVNEINPDVIAEKNANIIKATEHLPYVSTIMDPEELLAKGSRRGFSDLIIGAEPPHHFHLKKM